MIRARNDGVENWFVEEGPSNRMILSLRSPLLEEADWSLQRLLRASSDHNDRFVLDRWHASIEALLLWPNELLVLALGQGIKWGEALWDFENQAQKDLRRRAVESLLVIRNAGLNELANGKILSTHQALQRFLLDFLRTVDLGFLMDRLAEPLLLILDILHNMVLSPSFTPLSDFQTLLPPALLPFLRSKDRATLTAVLRLSHALSSPNAASPSAPPVVSFPHPLIEESVETSLTLLLLPHVTQPNIVLRTLSLDILYTHTLDPAHAAVVLKRSNIGPIFKLLGKGLYEGSEKRDVRFLLGGGTPADVWEGAPPGRSEMDAMAGMQEPLRSTYWMQRTFLPSPTSHVPQTQFWQLYREAFSPTTSSAKVVSPLLSATELINNVSQVFSGAQASLVDNVFVMKGIKVRGGSKVPTAQQLLTSTQETLHPPLNPTTSVPTGTSFTSALILRNLSRALLFLLEESPAKDTAEKQMMKDGEMFGLPIPEELRLSETEPGAGGPRETLSKEEEERSKVALWGVEGDVLEWVMKGGEGLSVWLSEVLEAISILSC